MKIDFDWIGSELVVKLDLQLNSQIGFKLDLLSLLNFAHQFRFGPNCRIPKISITESNLCKINQNKL